MSDKIYLGNRLSDFDIGEPSLPVSKVILNVDGENSFASGDDTGSTVEQNCPWATQAMADSVLEKLKGFVYNPYSGIDALLDPAAELGDALTVGGTYGVLAQLGRNLDRQSTATVGAPGTDEIDDEYPYKSKQRKETDRVLAKAYSRISKTAEEIRLEIQNEVEGLSSSFTVELDSISGEIVGIENSFSEMELTLERYGVRIQDAESNIAELELTTQDFKVSIEGLEGDYAELALTLDGLTVTDSTGTTKIRGSSIETDTLYVKAANITGQLVIGNMPSDVATEDQIPIYTSELINNSGYQTEQGVVSIIDGTVTADYIYALGLEVDAANVTGTLSASALALDGIMELTYGSSVYGLMGINRSKGGPVLCDADGAVGVIVTSNAAKLTYQEDYMIWVASGGCFSSYTMQVYSDKRMKNSIDYDFDKYEAMFMALKPCTFKYNSEGDSAKPRFGFVAQEVIEAAETNGLTRDDFSLVGEYNDTYTIGYGEMPAWNTYMIQKIIKALAEMGVTV